MDSNFKMFLSRSEGQERCALGCSWAANECVIQSRIEKTFEDGSKRYSRMGYMSSVWYESHQYMNERVRNVYGYRVSCGGS